MRAIKILSRVWPGLAPAAVGAGVAIAPETASAVRCASISGGVFCLPGGPPTVFRTGGAAAQAWAFGTLTEAVKPRGGACDLATVCDLVIQSGAKPGAGAGFTIMREFATGDFAFPSNLPFVLDEAVDYTHPSANGGGGWCYPATGTVRVEVGASGTLVLDFEGQACQLGSNEEQALLLNGAYTGDSASTGKFANAGAIGNFTIEGPSGLKGGFRTTKVSLNGQLLLAGEPPP
jgi:hypothetical protein